MNSDAYERKESLCEAMAVSSPNGKTRNKTVYVTESKAELSAVQEKNSMAQNPISSITLKELAESWLESKKGTVKNCTFASYSNAVECILRYWGADKIVDDISDTERKSFEDYLNNSCGENTKRIRIFAYNSILKHNKDNNPLIANHNCDIDKTEFLDKTEMEVIKEKCAMIDKPISTAILILCFTGMKSGELCALTWDDVNVEKNEIVVNKTLTRIRQISKHTSYFEISDVQERHIKIPQKLGEILKKRKVDGCYVATNKEKYQKPQMFFRNFKNYIKKYCAIQKAVTPTTLRSSFIVNAIQSSINLKFLSEITGVQILFFERTYFKYIDWGKFDFTEDINKL